MFARMSAAGAVLCGDVRPLEMTTGNESIGPMFPLARFADCSKPRRQRLVRVRNQRRADPRQSETKVLLENRQNFVGRDADFAEPRPPVAVNLQIEQPRGDKRPAGCVARGPGWLDGDDSLPIDGDLDRFAVLIMSAMDRKHGFHLTSRPLRRETAQSKSARRLPTGESG